MVLEALRAQAAQLAHSVMPAAAPAAHSALRATARTADMIADEMFFVPIVAVTTAIGFYSTVTYGLETKEWVYCKFDALALTKHLTSEKKLEALAACELPSFPFYSFCFSLLATALVIPCVRSPIFRKIGQIARHVDQSF